MSSVHTLSRLLILLQLQTSCGYLLSYNRSSLYRPCTDHTENTANVLLYNVIEHVQAARAQTKHYSSIVGCVCCWHCLAMALHVTILLNLLNILPSTYSIHGY
jgi:hypothetical protein